MLIYKITNNLNGMKYVGQTIRKLSERLKAHKSLKNNKCPYLKTLSPNMVLIIFL